MILTQKKKRIKSKFVIESTSIPHINLNIFSRNEAKDDGAKGKLFETFIQNLNNWTIGNNFKLPPPHHLRYRYPSPTAVILLNIVNALSYSTKLYTQVSSVLPRLTIVIWKGNFLIVGENSSILHLYFPVFLVWMRLPYLFSNYFSLDPPNVPVPGLLSHFSFFSAPTLPPKFNTHLSVCFN